MANAPPPTLDNRRTKDTFDLFKELGCLRNGGDGELTINDVGRLDEEKMMARALDCLAAVREIQRVRVALKEPLKLREDGDALTPEQQAARNKVFRAAMNTVATGLTHDGAERDDPGFPITQLLRAFPDSDKLKDGRGWLPMHWAVVADGDKVSDLTEADVMTVYKMDLMALREHHILIADPHLGYTPAHMLCGLEMTEKNMSLVRLLSLSDPRAFTMKTSSPPFPGYSSFSALHVACMNRRRTEALLRLLVQLDPSQTKVGTTSGGPLGLLCESSEDLDERQFDCLVEADSSTEVVYGGIKGCFARQSTVKNRVLTVAKLLDVNPAAAQHTDEAQKNLAHHACYHGDQFAAADCIKILKLVLARHKDALKEADNDGKLPAHHVAEYGPVEVLDFVLGEYPEAAAAVDGFARNLLHLVAGDAPVEDQRAKVHLLCARFPAMMLQRDCFGETPLHIACRWGYWAFARLLCEAGGQEAAAATVLIPTHLHHEGNGWLPLHLMICGDYAATLTTEPLSDVADAFRLLLRLYPEAAGIEGGVGAEKITPYRLAVEENVPAFYLRLLLRAAPDLDPAELRRLNWAERRMAMFVTFAAVAETPSLLARLRAENKDLVKHVVSFL